MKYFFFTIKKMIKRTSIIGVLLACILLSVVYFSVNVYRSDKFMRNLETELNERILSYDERVESPEDEEDLAYVTDALQSTEEELTAIKGSTEDYLEYFIQKEMLYLYGLNETYPDETTEYAKLIATELLKNDIQPMFPLSYLIDDILIGHMSEEAQEYWRENNPTFYERGVYFIWYLVKGVAILGILVIIMLMLFAPLASEKDLNKHLNLLKSEGLSSSTIYFSAYISRILIMYVFIVAFFLVTFGVTSMINGVGSFNYPVLLFTDKSIFRTMALSDYLTQTSVLILLVGLFVSSYSQLVEALIPQRFLSLLVEIGIFFIAFILPYHKWNPFSYFQFNKIITEGFPKTLEDYLNSSNIEMTVLNNATITLIVSSLVCVLVGYVIFVTVTAKKRG